MMGAARSRSLPAHPVKVVPRSGALARGHRAPKPWRCSRCRHGRHVRPRLTYARPQRDSNPSKQSGRFRPA